MVSYNYFEEKAKKHLPTWNGETKKPAYRHLCLISVLFAFSIGLLVGILIPLVYFKNTSRNMTVSEPLQETEAIRTVFVNNSYGFEKNMTEFSTVSFVYGQESDYLQNGVYWSKKVEDLIPHGYGNEKHSSWKRYVENGVAVKLEHGCGRMQNRMVTFQDGSRGCVRYRQNIDQIQGELFSFYLGQVLKLQNLAPSVVSVVDLKSNLWKGTAHDIAAAQWNSNRPIVLTKFVPNLDSASIPSVFKPNERHLNKHDVYNMSENSVDDAQLFNNFAELAQWSDLIIFDYLTANLDRIVNNLFNYQWNANIMDAPAHNLAKDLRTNLLVFLDNESGLLHGYRLLQKYEKYHSILLENLCIFRKQTADIIKELKKKNNIGFLLKDMFEKKNSVLVKDVLPTLPEKSIKILNERIDKVYNQILKCESIFSDEIR